MFLTLTVGVLSSIAAEIVVWFNKKLGGTPLAGKASFLLAAAIALVVSAFQVVMSGTPLNDWGTLATTFAQIWTVSQGFFVIIVETLGLDVRNG